MVSYGRYGPFRRLNYASQIAAAQSAKRPFDYYDAPDHPEDDLLAPGFVHAAEPCHLRRLRIFPFKRNSWLANMAIYRGLTYYYGRRGRPLPRFSDYLAADHGAVIARSLGETTGR